jgi:hypothetical protein
MKAGRVRPSKQTAWLRDRGAGVPTRTGRRDAFAPFQPPRCSLVALSVVSTATCVRCTRGRYLDRVLPATGPSSFRQERDSDTTCAFLPRSSANSIGVLDAQIHPAPPTRLRRLRDRRQHGHLLEGIAALDELDRRLLARAYRR